MTVKSKLQRILDVLNGADNKTLEGFKAFDSGVQKLKDEMLKTIKASTLDEVNDKIGGLKKSLSLDPLIKSVDTLRNDFYQTIEKMAEEIDKMMTEHGQMMETKDKESMGRHADMASQMEKMHEEVLDLIDKKTKELSDLSTQFNTLVSSTAEEFKGKIEEVSGRVDKVEGDIKEAVNGFDTKIGVARNEAERAVVNLREDFMNRGGGQANRNIAVGGNTSVLSKYGDINLRAGQNVTLTYSQNNTTKYTDLTISATGGSGTTRSINTTNVSSIVGATAGTDYVVIAGAGVKITFPPASSNTNLYTIKNKAASSVLLTPDGTDTIDGQTNLILATQFTSVDLISDGVGDWQIT